MLVEGIGQPAQCGCCTSGQTCSALGMLAEHRAGVPSAVTANLDADEIAQLHRLPGETPHVETELEPDELITAVELPAAPVAPTPRYRKVERRPNARSPCSNSGGSSRPATAADWPNYQESST